jgi:hypothetical protein
MKSENFIRLLAGLVVLASVALTQYVDPNWVWLTVFAGANLIQSVFTGFCPPVWLLGKLGWIDANDVITGPGARR